MPVARDADAVCCENAPRIVAREILSRGIIIPERDGRWPPMATPRRARPGPALKQDAGGNGAGATTLPHPASTPRTEIRREIRARGFRALGGCGCNHHPGLRRSPAVRTAGFSTVVCLRGRPAGRRILDAPFVRSRLAFFHTYIAPSRRRRTIRLPSASASAVPRQSSSMISTGPGVRPGPFFEREAPYWRLYGGLSVPLGASRPRPGQAWAEHLLVVGGSLATALAGTARHCQASRSPDECTDESLVSQLPASSRPSCVTTK